MNKSGQSNRRQKIDLFTPLTTNHNHGNHSTIQLIFSLSSKAANTETPLTVPRIGVPPPPPKEFTSTKKIYQEIFIGAAEWMKPPRYYAHREDIPTEVLALFVLSFIPWPGPTIFKISCPRDSATVVRRIIQKKWIPVLEKYHVKLPMECPFHPTRDIFWPQQSAKQQHRPSQWTCGLCGKSFYSEAYLDMHFDNRHKTIVNMAEDAVCLADYCDIMRCDVVRKHIMSEPTPGDGMHVNTDIEIWREATSYHTALSPAGPRDLARVSSYTSAFRQQQTTTSNSIPPVSSPGGINSPSCSRTEGPHGEGDTNNTGEGCDNLVDSAVPPKQRISEFQRLKANCKPDVLQKIKTRCEILVRDCIAGLLVNLSTQNFQEIEEELNHAVCWYLTCDRYWEDTTGDLRPFPWGLLFVLVMALSLFICLCYYIVWVLFDSDDMSVASTSVTASSSPARHSHYSEEYYPVSDDLGQNEHYIYVTYPPDLKRRLLERTTRL